MWFAISELEESVAKIGFIREGLEEVLKCSVDANREKEKIKTNKRDFNSLLFKSDYNTLPNGQWLYNDYRLCPLTLTAPSLSLISKRTSLPSFLAYAFAITRF